jgi:hypothetical protein
VHAARQAVLVVLLGAAAFAPAVAQGDELRIRAARRDTVRAAATVTAGFAVTNARSDSVQVRARVEMPAEWTLLMGGAPFWVAAGSTDILMVSVAVPARIVAGVYPLRVWVTTSASAQGTMDSVLVLVPQRRAVEAALLDRPGFVVSGKSYDASFLVRNRGNARTELRLAARSSLGAATLADTLVRLAPDESRVVRVRVRTPAGLQAAVDDVLELDATHAEAASEATETSARVTVVPEPDRTIEEFLKVPTQVRLRAASSDAVSPFEVTGHGMVRDGSETQLDFLFRGPTGPFSAFGERDEYRAQVIAPSWRARAGDQFFVLSPLTGGAQPGLGLGADAARGAFTLGGYGQQFRRDPLRGTEAGASLGARVHDDARISANFVNRNGGESPGRVGSATASFDREFLRAKVELARSTSNSGEGLGRMARLSGAWSELAYDAGYLEADTAFSGPQRGSAHNYLNASSQHFDWITFGVSGSNYRKDLSRSTGVPYVERLNIGTTSATLYDRYTLELAMITRGTTVSGLTQRAEQRGARARADHDFRFGALSVEIEGGRAREPGHGAIGYTDVSMTGRRTLRGGAIAFWAEQYSGGSITKGQSGTITLGGDASMRVSRTMDVTLRSYATRLRAAGEEWHSQIDATLSRLLPNGSTVSLRARLLGGGNLPLAEQSVAYLEYGVPLRLPISRLRTPGRVFGRVVDATTRQGVPGALVRLGPQVAITDDRGQVAFGGVPGGAHRLSMSQETAFANAVFVGDPTLVVDSTRAQPTTFELAIARSARVEIVVRRISIARRGIGGAADSLADAGALANATLVLAGSRDTLYRTTGEDGTVSFTDVPPGRWTISIRGDAPAFHRFEPDRIELELAPGESKSVSFHLVPRRREVQLIGESQELRPTRADPKSQTPAPGTKTIKPNHQ